MYIMATSISALQKEVIELREDVERIKHVLYDEGELTVYAEQAIKKARARSQFSYVDFK